jgi:protein SCO1/2
MKKIDGLTRRQLLLASAGLVLAQSRLALAHGVGIVWPAVHLPAATPLLLSDGAHMPLSRVFANKMTVVQLMFTGCSEVCPLQGALFEAIQDSITKLDGGRFQLLSISIDPMDNCYSLSSWLRRFNAGKAWQAAVPLGLGIDVVRAALQAGAQTTRPHTSQVYFVDRLSRLVWRSEDFPPEEVVLEIAQRIVRSSTQG